MSLYGVALTMGDGIFSKVSIDLSNTPFKLDNELNHFGKHS